MSATSPILKRSLSFSYVSARLNYDAQTGKITWREKPVLRQHDKTWNTRFAGRAAGSVDPAGYFVITLEGRHYRSHQIAWLLNFGAWSPGELDHINRRRGDNRIGNLRPASKSQNAINSSTPRNNTSGYRGVHWHDGARKWRASIKINQRRLHIGYFADAAEAGSAYFAAAQKHFGEFAVMP